MTLFSKIRKNNKTLRLIVRIIDFRIVAWLLVAVVALATCSCSTVKCVPVETIKNDSIYIAQVRCDSIYVKDSVYVREKADTIFIARTQWRFRDRVVRDTLRISKCDTIVRTVKIEKELTGWQKAKMSVGGYAIVCSAILVAIWFAKRLKGL